MPLDISCYVVYFMDKGNKAYKKGGRMKKHYTLSFAPGTLTEVTGSKEELIGELQNLIDEIGALDEEDTGVSQTVVIYDTNGTDYIEARINEN